MSLDYNSVLFVVNEDDENIVSIINGTSSVFASETFLDDPRGMTLGPVYTASSASNTGTNSFSASNTGSNASNDEPGFMIMYDGIVTQEPVQLTSTLSTFTVSATDPEGDAITISTLDKYGDMPDGSVLVTDYTNGTATITVNSTGVTSATYAIYVEVSDSKDNSDVEPFVVIVP
ncbi:MAG: hypothetical protein IS860_04620 [Nitrosopumilus sp.]|nr:hypothetical protein [Nitrosopumilus sp.]